jgi:hypothetical protein
MDNLYPMHYRPTPMIVNRLRREVQGRRRVPMTLGDALCLIGLTVQGVGIATALVISAIAMASVLMAGG